MFLLKKLNYKKPIYMAQDVIFLGHSNENRGLCYLSRVLLQLVSHYLGFIRFVTIRSIYSLSRSTQKQKLRGTNVVVVLTEISHLSCQCSQRRGQTFRSKQH